MQSGIVWGLDPATSVEKYIHHSWSTRDGLPQNTIYCITQDKAGYIWIGTDQGVVRFDGHRFVNFHRGNTEALENNTITTIHAAENGALWIGTYGGGVTRLHERKFEHFSTENGLTSRLINQVVEDSDKNLWFATIGGGVMLYKDGAFSPFTKSAGLSFEVTTYLLPDHRGYLWIATEKGLNRLNIKTKKIDVFTAKDGLAGDNIRSLFEDRKGYLWIGTTTGFSVVRNTALELKRKRFISVTSKNGLAGDWVRSITEDRHGNIWIATDGGLNRIAPAARKRIKDGQKGWVGEIEQLTADHGLTGNVLTALFEDKAGNLWIGTSGSGLNMLREGKFDFYTPKDGLSSGYIKAIFQDRDNIVWIGTNGGGLNRLKDGKFMAFTRDDGLSSNYIGSLCGDKQGNLWIGTADGLNRMTKGKFTVYTEENGLSNNSIRALYHDRKDNVWIGTFGGGLNRWNNGRFDHFTAADGLCDNFVLALEEDSYGNLWIGTNKGVSCFDYQRRMFRNFKTGAQAPKGIILDIYCDPDGVTWIAANSEGLVRYKDGVFTHVKSSGRPAGSVIYGILEDDRANLWFTSNKGIYSASRRMLNRSVDRKGVFVNWRHFQEADGLMTAVCTGGFQPAAWKSKEGTIWFPTTKGIAVMDLNRPALVVKKEQGAVDLPRQFKGGISYMTVSREEPVVIEKITADGKTFTPKNRLVLPPGTKRIQFYYTAIRYGAHGDTAFKYRLEGYDNDWTKTGERKSKLYKGLPGGEYRFVVVADQGTGRWDSPAAACRLSIKTPFYGSFWFYLLLTAVVVGSVYSVPKLLKRQKEEEQPGTPKYKGSSMTVKKSRKHLDALLKLVNEEKPHLDPDITLQKLAKRLDITKEDLSRVINEQLKKNFKNFINERRIDEAKKRILDPKEKDFVLLKIAFDVGFNSKSAFNASFKKFTGLSPSQYRKKHEENATEGDK